MNIKTSPTFAPMLPNWDWLAWDDDSYEQHYLGHGATEQEAIQDLKEQLELSR